ncbi:PD-(D/E)XK nuclease family protein [Nocardiopsis nanhaiensis]
MGTVDGTLHPRRERPAAEIAIAAHTTAIGLPAWWPSPREWKKPFTPIGPPPASGQVRSVRVVEIGLLDGSRNILFDGSPHDAKVHYEEHGRPLNMAIVAGGTPVPGASCAECKALNTCEERVAAPGLLGITPSGAPLRTVSVSDLRHHSECPAQYHLRTLRLPKTQEYWAGHRRGKAVHAWLEEAHRPTAARKYPCASRDTPKDPASWSSPEWELPPDEARLGAQMIARHAEVCPFTSMTTDIRPEPDLAFYDAHANAVVVARPDLLFYEEGAPVWRETKTLRSGRVSRRHIFRRYPQLALALLILDSGHLGGEREGARVELEVLYPDRLPTLITLHPNEPEDIEEAREELHALTRCWHDDTAFPSRPQEKACGSCPVSRWCPDAVLPEGE